MLTDQDEASCSYADFAITDNYRAFLRRALYVTSAIADDPIMQQRGIATIPDFRGTWKSSPLQILRLVSSIPSHALPFHDASIHALYDESGKHDLIQTVRKFIPKHIRMRVRLHFGSPLETTYALRTFGLNVPREFFREDDPFSNGDNSEYDATIEEDICRRKQLDDEWRRSEAPYRDPASPVALFPNPQDIIMGRHKVVAATWPGNVMYRKVIHQHVNRYIERQDEGADRTSMALISVLEILHVLQDQNKSRFLNRENNRWVVIEDLEARVKIGRALRSLAKEIAIRKG